MSRERAIENAMKHWEKDENCAQSTSCAILEIFNFEKEKHVLKDAFVPFGGGIGEKSICGTVTGTLAGISFVLSQNHISEEVILSVSEEYKERFKTIFNHLKCKQLLKVFMDEDGNYSESDNSYRRNKCTFMVQTAVKIATELIMDEIQPLKEQ